MCLLVKICVKDVVQSKMFVLFTFYTSIVFLKFRHCLYLPASSSYEQNQGCPDNFGGLAQNFQLPPPPNVKVLAFYLYHAFGDPLSLGPGKIAPFAPPSLSSPEQNPCVQQTSQHP